MNYGKDYAVTLYVRVIDEAALIAAGQERAKIDVGGSLDADDENMDAPTALRWLLDPGVSPPGCEIQDSSVE